MKSNIEKSIQDAKSSNTLEINNEKITDENWLEIDKLLHLKNLYLHEIENYEFPDKLKNLKKLEQIHISGGEIKKFPSFILKLPKLTLLGIGFTKISDFSFLKNLSNLIYLHLFDYNFVEIPHEIFNLKNLKTLILRSNNIKHIPNKIVKLTSLTELDLYDNLLSKIPHEIFNLKNLKTLRLVRNNIKHIPSKIVELTNLTDLDLYDNLLSEIPDEIFNLKNLKTLRLGRNNIKHIPSKIVELTNLMVLDLYDNLLSEIPYEISELRNLSFPTLLNNPLNSLQFGYVLPIKDDLYKLVNKIKKLFDIDNIQKHFISIKNKDNYAFIKITHKLYTEGMRREFIIYVFGKTETQKNILFDIRNQLEKWIKENIKSDANRKGYKKEKIVSRFFYYPIHKKYNQEIVIDYDKLLKYKEANQYAYFDDVFGEKFPVSDLLSYINTDDVLLDKKWNGTNYLSQIKIKNLKLFENIEFKLNSKINILLGHNGLGKTSILQGITMGLLPTENIDKPDNFIEYIKFGNERTEIYINYGDYEQRIIHVIPSGLIEMQHIENPPHILLSYGVNLNADTKIDLKFYEQIIEGNAKSYSTKSIFKDYSNDFNDPLIILYELQKESKHKYKLKTIIKLIVSKINDYLDLVPENEKIQLIEENDFFTFKDLNNNKLKLHNLSEGYKDHVLLISDILFRIISARNVLFKDKTINEDIFRKAKGVILIDEFDRHLHIIWQRRLLIQLKKDFQNIQFILTTHNVFSLQPAVGATAHQILIKENVIYIESSKIKAKNILSIIREFYTKDFFDYETQNELNLLSEYLDKIHDGEIDLVYSENFHKTVEKLNNMGEEIQSIIASQLLQLNSALKKIGKKEFVL